MSADRPTPDARAAAVAEALATWLCAEVHGQRSGYCVNCYSKARHVATTAVLAALDAPATEPDTPTDEDVTRWRGPEAEDLGAEPDITDPADGLSEPHEACEIAHGAGRLSEVCEQCRVILWPVQRTRGES